MRLLLGCLIFVLACDDGSDANTVAMQPGGDAGHVGDAGDADWGPDDGLEPEGDAGESTDAAPDAEADAMPPEPTVCRIASTTFTRDGVIFEHTTFVYDRPGRRSPHLINRDEGGDGTVDAITRIEYPEDTLTVVRVDTDADGAFDSISQTRTVTSDDRLTVTQLTIRDMDRTAYHSEFLSGDRNTPEGIFARVRETDDGDNDTVNSRTESSFEDGKIVRQTQDSGPARWNRDDEVGPDGTPEIVTMYTYTANSVTESTDRGRATCTDGVCEAVVLDGEVDSIVERIYGADGRPEMIWAGRPDLQRDDHDADGVWDRLTEYTYDERGITSRVRFDNEADGIWESELSYVYECTD